MNKILLKFVQTNTKDVSLFQLSIQFRPTKIQPNDAE